MKRPRIHREGRGLIVGTVLLLFLINIPVYMLTTEMKMQWIFGVTLALAAMLLVFVTYFFRNPVRVLEIDDPNFIIAPADGRVVVVEPTEETEYFHEPKLQVSIFMSPFNVHANWYPIETYAKVGHQAHRNTHLGFIKLGSRVDMYLPLNTEMFVTVGEAVRGNETIIGRLQDDPEINTNEA